MIAGDNQSYGGDAYGIIGWETGEIELTLRTEPECEKKIYFSQEPMLHPINTDNNISTCGGSAQVRSAIGDKVYFGGGYSGRGYQNSVMGNSQHWSDETTDFTILDTRTDALTALRPLPVALVWGSAAVIDDKAYVASLQGEVYIYDPKADTWTSSGFNVGRCDALYPMGSELCTVDNASGTVTKYSTSGRKRQSLSLAKGNTVVAVTETANRTWLMIDNDLYIHDAQGLRQLTTLPNNGVVSACNGLFYYYADDEGGVSSYNPTTNQHMRVPMFLMTRGGPGVSTFHSGLPVITDGVCYLLNCGYTCFGDITWSGAQEKNLIRIDMSQSYHVIVK